MTTPKAKPLPPLRRARADSILAYLRSKNGIILNPEAVRFLCSTFTLTKAQLEGTLADLANGGLITLTGTLGGIEALPVSGERAQ